MNYVFLCKLIRSYLITIFLSLYFEKLLIKNLFLNFKKYQKFIRSGHHLKIVNHNKVWWFLKVTQKYGCLEWPTTHYFENHEYSLWYILLKNPEKSHWTCILWITVQNFNYKRNNFRVPAPLLCYFYKFPHFISIYF
jgi:hypothetical protein